MAVPVYYNPDDTPMSYLTQWDKNLTLIVKGAETSPVPDFHFSNKKSKTALVVKPTVSSGSMSAKIPNVLLQDALPIIVDMYYQLSDGTYKTRYTTLIPVIPKSRPSDYEYVEPDGYNDIGEEVVISDNDPGSIALLWVDTSDV